MRKILIVDDDQGMRSMISDALDESYDITVAACGKEALKSIALQSYDLVITDLVMPNMNGIDLVMAILNENPQQKVIAISGGGGISGRFDYLPVVQLIGANKILRKPFKITELRQAVADSLDTV